jgi:hypothetical protein
VTGLRHWWFSEVVARSLRSRQIGQLIYGLWHTDDPLARRMLLDLIETFRPLAHHAAAQGGGTASTRARLSARQLYAPLTLDELAQVAR